VGFDVPNEVLTIGGSLEGVWCVYIDTGALPPH
jgi:hypothetical protein